MVEKWLLALLRLLLHLTVCHIPKLWVSCDFCRINLHHLIDQRSGLAVKKTWRKYSQPFSHAIVMQKGDMKNPIFDQYLALSRKRYNNNNLAIANGIARQLRTQYAEGIYRHKYYTVTLKSRLSVTQGHWKRNHWIDHTRLSSSRVIWRWILLW